MKILVDNATLSVRISLSALRLVGFWPPEGITGYTKILYTSYTCFSFMFLLGTYLTIQVVDLFIIWGDLPMMTGVAFILFTNLAQAIKILNLLVRRRRIQAIISEADEVLRSVGNKEAKKIVESCNRETTLQQVLYFLLTAVTTTGWATSAEKNKLPLRAWYPYDTSRSPAYELTYIHQVGALMLAAFLNVGKDTLVTALIAQCCCRLQLLRLQLRTLGDQISDGVKRLRPDEENSLDSRIRRCVLQHQAALAAAIELQTCFSEPTFMQFNVSLIIICVTAFQLISQTGNLVRLLSMGTYLLNMMFQVFLYCYQGNQLSEESSEIAGAAYESPWYRCSPGLRGTLLIIMTRTRRVARITAGRFTTLSITSFMAIIKASYSLFTLLQQVDEKN